MEYRIFRLTMPNNNAWNGRWTGEGEENLIIRSYKNGSKILQNVDKKNYHYYNFGDGWGAGVEIRIVSKEEAQEAKRRAEGFRGYSWMVDEIEKFGRILTISEHRRIEK